MWSCGIPCWCGAFDAAEPVPHLDSPDLLEHIVPLRLFWPHWVCALLPCFFEASCTRPQHSSPSFLDYSACISGMVFAFTGQPIMLEMQAEMREPQHFPKAVWLSYSILFVVYTCVAVLSYLACGRSTPGDILLGVAGGLAEVLGGCIDGNPPHGHLHDPPASVEPGYLRVLLTGCSGTKLPCTAEMVRSYKLRAGCLLLLGQPCATLPGLERCGSS